MKTLLSIDFDGVLHPHDSTYGVDDLSLPVSELLAAGLFIYCQALEDLLSQLNQVELLIHSSWRLTCGEARIREVLGPLGHRMRGVSTPSIEDREKSVLDMLRRWQIPRDRVVVLDDQPFLFRMLRDRLVACPPHAGVPAMLTELDEALKRATQ
ncbi:HAD domain-containing protein [Roseateles sp.]|uniref:HAD domain-containing protein n=1 Tax=Roseateles sp. TaxID=1971397 RepID=UPI0031E1C515